MRNNSDKCELEYKGQKFPLTDYFDVSGIKEEKLYLKLIILNERLSNLSNMFNLNQNLLSITGIENLDTCEIYNMSDMFAQCSSLESLPDISKWNMSKVKSMSNMFLGCYSLKTFHDISKWSFYSL